MGKRAKAIDAAKGILILLVVVAHAKVGLLHDLIFLFHMPLFFMISGFLLNKDKSKKKKYLTNKLYSLLCPYAVYLIVDTLIVKKEHTINNVLYILWGGRAITGVYWYITCLLCMRQIRKCSEIFRVFL